jgi:quinol monooxygenase YgiN
MPKLLTVVAQMHAQPGKEDALRQVLLTLIEPTRKEEGCVQYDLHEENGQPGHFVFYENWRSKEALDLHLASPHFTAILPRLAELCSRPAEIAACTRIA